MFMYGDGLASHPGESRNTPSLSMLLKPGTSAGLMGHLTRMETLPFYLHV